MENTVKVEKLLQEMDEKLENEETLCYIKDFYSYLNQVCIKELDVCKRGRTTHGCKKMKKIALCKKHIQQYKDNICLLRLDLQIESETDAIPKRINIVNYYASIFFYEVLEKICIFEFFKNDFITEKWSKNFCKHLKNRSDFYIIKIQKIYKLRNIKKFKKTLKDADKIIREMDENLERQTPEYRENFISGLYYFINRVDYDDFGMFGDDDDEDDDDEDDDAFIDSQEIEEYLTLMQLKLQTEIVTAATEGKLFTINLIKKFLFEDTYYFYISYKWINSLVKKYIDRSKFTLRKAENSHTKFPYFYEQIKDLDDRTTICFKKNTYLIFKDFET